MYLSTDVFNHDLHMEKVGGNKHCTDCHTDLKQPKIRENTKSCLECHRGMLSEGSRVKIDSLMMNTEATGYMDAMHKLCIPCHVDAQKTDTSLPEGFTNCTNCHRSLPGLKDKAWEGQS